MLDKVVAQTDALGNINTVDYDAVGIKVRQTDANGNSVVTRTDVLGHETATTDALGHTSTKFYDSLGRLAREVDATGHQTVYGYDVFDRRVTVTDGLGALIAAEGDHTTVFHYDQRDRMVQVDQAQGWHLANDASDIYQAERTRLGYGNVDELSDAQRAELVALYSQHASYDGRNNRTSMTDANGHVTREVYDALGRVTDTITMQNGVEVHNRRDYDIYGNLMVEVDGDGRTQTHRYAGFSRLVEDIDAGGNRTSYSYNRLGQKVTESSTDGKSITRTYDEAGHLLGIADAATGVSTVFGYNANGQRVLERITTPGNAHNRDIAYQYDNMGRQVRWADGVTGLHLNYSWDAAGNQQRVYTDAGYVNAVDHSYRYDEANRVTGMDNTGGSMISGYSYDAAGNRTSYNNGSAIATYTYDAMNRVVSGASGATTSNWAYDRVGNVVSYTGEDGKTTTYKYYENNRNWYTQGENETTISLDLAGHTTQMTMRADGKTYYYSYSYLADGREASIRGYGDAAGSSTSTYDANHNRIAVNKGKGDGQDRAEVSNFVFSNEDKILFERHDDGKKDSQVEQVEYLYANGYQVGETGNDNKGVQKTELDVGRYNLVQNIGKEFPTTAVTMYVAHEGDTLQSIAAAMYGNPSLWYLIADANGLSPTDRIHAGSEIKVPNSVHTGALTADTHRVYNESDIIGSTLPNLKTPPPPGKGGCASILMIIVVIVIAVLVPGAVAFLANIIGPALFGGAFVAGTVSLATVASFAIAGAIVGAAASVITQGVAIALGLQESFSWKAVAAGAVAGAFSGAAQGLGAAAAATAAKTGQTVQYAQVAVAALKVAGVASQQLIQHGKITSWSSLASAGLEGYFGTQAETEAALGERAAFQAGAQSMDAIREAGVTAAMATRNLQNTISYITPWVNLAETAVRNDGKLTASDWATAVGTTLSTAAANGAIGESLFGDLSSTARNGITNLLVGGALSAFDKEGGKDYLINAAGTWAGQYLGHGLGGMLFPPEARTLASYGGAPELGGAKPAGGLIAAADRDEENQQKALGIAGKPALFASSGAIMSDMDNPYLGVDIGGPKERTAADEATFKLFMDAFSAPRSQSGPGILLDDFGNPTTMGAYDGASMLEPQLMMGSTRLIPETQDLGSASLLNMRLGGFDDIESTNALKKLMIDAQGRIDPGFTKEIQDHMGGLARLSSAIGFSDRANEVVRMYALPQSDTYSELQAMLDPVTRNLADGVTKEAFFAKAQGLGLRMVVQESGITNSVLQSYSNGLSLAMELEAQGKPSLVLNAYNATQGSKLDLVESVLGKANVDTASIIGTRIAIREAMAYNSVISNQLNPVFTQVWGHSEGSIIVNQAVEGIDPALRSNIDLRNFGVAIGTVPNGMNSYSGVGNKNDSVYKTAGQRFTSTGGIMNSDNFIQSNLERPGSYSFTETNFKVASGGQPVKGNDNHSWQYYMSEPTTRQALGLIPLTTRLQSYYSRSSWVRGE